MIKKTSISSIVLTGKKAFNIISMLPNLQILEV